MNAPVKKSSVMPSSTMPVGFGPGGPSPAPTPWTLYGTYVQWSGGVVVGNAVGGGMGSGTINATAYFVDGVIFDTSNFLSTISGGVVEGPVTFSAPVTFSNTVDGMVLDMGTF